MVLLFDNSFVRPSDFELFVICGVVDELIIKKNEVFLVVMW